MTRPYLVTITTTYRVDAADADDAADRADVEGRMLDQELHVEPDGWPVTWTRDGLHRREVTP